MQYIDIENKWEYLEVLTKFKESNYDHWKKIKIKWGQHQKVMKYFLEQEKDLDFPSLTYLNKCIYQLN